MELIKRQNIWEPLDLFSDLQEDLNRAFRRSFAAKDWERTFNPVVEVREDATQYTVHADLPGLQKEDFSISVEKNRLTIKGERKEEKETKEKGYRYSERSYGAFSRSMDFATDIQADQVKAAYKNGVLEIVLPKSEASKPKQVQVEVK